MSNQILILGAGLMGRVAAYFFVQHPQGRHGVTLVDAERNHLDSAAKWLNSPLVTAANCDVADSKALRELAKGHKVCLSCVPYFLGPNIAKICLSEGVSYLDLGGNPDVTDDILGMGEQAKAKGVALIPDTGLAPGLTNILATELVSRFKKCESAHIRVGGLPQDPKGPLKYAQFFSIYGLLNEYLEAAREIRDGVEVEVASLTDVEALRFEGIGDLESFITSGGTSTLPKTLTGKVRRLSYKTIRFPGHCAALNFLREIGLTETAKFSFGEIELSPRQMLISVLDNYLPKQVADMVLVRVTSTGDGGREEKIEFVCKHDVKNNISAMGQTTSFPAAAIALAIVLDRVPPGAHPQESVIPYAWMKEQLGLFGIGI